MKKFIDFVILSKYVDGKRRKLFTWHLTNNLAYIRIWRVRLACNWRENIARILYRIGIKPTWSSNIADELTCGYGRLDNNGFWRFQLPKTITDRILKS
jgi:hypothetical protein